MILSLYKIDYKYIGCVAHNDAEWLDGYFGKKDGTCYIERKQDFLDAIEDSKRQDKYYPNERAKNQMLTILSSMDNLTFEISATRKGE